MLTEQQYSCGPKQHDQAESIQQYHVSLTPDKNEAPGMDDGPRVRDVFTLGVSKLDHHNLLGP
jgi:hypothetical protein